MQNFNDNMRISSVVIMKQTLQALATLQGKTVKKEMDKNVVLTYGAGELDVGNPEAKVQAL